MMLYKCVLIHTLFFLTTDKRFVGLVGLDLNFTWDMLVLWVCWGHVLDLGLVGLHLGLPGTC